MKTIVKISMIAALALITASGFAQQNPDEYLGLPGDNLNLYAVMNLFQESETLEAFERNLNDQESTINNLDLNGDNLIDYITVSDYVEKEVHNIVLRTALNGTEQQDIAVFVVEKLRDGEVQIQLIGDEALYGRNYIVEPIYAETPNPGYSGNVNIVNTNYYQVAAWPVIRYVYRPGYVVWRSSWYWGYYPTYWNPWTPHYWHYYYGYHTHWNNHYHSRYRHWDHYRSNSYTTYYRSRVRVYSPTVIVNIDKGRYNSSYSRPDQRRAGEEYYTRTASRRTQTGVSNQRSNSRNGEVRTQQRSQRTTTPSNGSRTGVSTSQRKTDAVSRTSTQRTTTPTTRTTGTSRTSQDRGTAIQRSSTKPAVQRSSSTRSSQAGSTKPAVQRSSNKSSSQAVQRSSSNRNSSSAVSRSTSNRSSKPAVSRSSSKSSKPAVSRSSSSKSSKPAVSRSASKSTKPAASRSSSSKSKSSRSTKK